MSSRRRALLGTLFHSLSQLAKAAIMETRFIPGRGADARRDVRRRMDGVSRQDEAADLRDSHPYAAMRYNVV